MSISARKRFEILKRDGFACHYCGRRVPQVILHVDHIVARANGGTDDPGNLIAACVGCNLGKHTADVLGDDERLHIWAGNADHAIHLLLALITGMDVERIKRGAITARERSTLEAAANRLVSAPISIRTPGEA